MAQLERQVDRDGSLAKLQERRAAMYAKLEALTREIRSSGDPKLRSQVYELKRRIANVEAAIQAWGHVARGIERVV